MPAPDHAAHSVTGSLHLEASVPNQDACQSHRSPPFSLYAVLDGHGPSGELIAAAAADQLLHAAAKRLDAPAQPPSPQAQSQSQSQHPSTQPQQQQQQEQEQPNHDRLDRHHQRHDRALRAAFAAAAEHVDAHPAAADSGTTATLLLHDASSATLSLANVGDSTAVAARRGRAPRRLSAVHRPTSRPRSRQRARSRASDDDDANADKDKDKDKDSDAARAAAVEDEETRRVTCAGAVVRDGYVCDGTAPKMISVTRALGDRDVRALGVISVPHVGHYDARDVDFVIVASDGLWDAHGGVTEQAAVDAVYGCLDAGGSAADAVADLLDLARGRCTRPIDDTTIVVVCL